MTERRPLLLGVTGNIGTGKSTVAAMMGRLGATAIDADRVAHTVMRAGTPVCAQVVETFGPQVLGPDGEIDRKRLATIVFADPAALAELEAIVHPATVEAIGRRIAATRVTGIDGGVVVIEAIKLIEAGIADSCDSVWVVTCRPGQQIERAMRRGLTRAEAEQRVRSQSAQAKKIARADVVIDNSGSIGRTRAQVRTAWARLVGGRACDQPGDWPGPGGHV